MERLAALAITARIEACWAERSWSVARTNQWTDAMLTLDVDAAEATLARLRASNERCPSIAEFVTIARPSSSRTDDQHPATCECRGAGFLSVHERNEHRSWIAYQRCPHGPPTLFIEPSDTFNPAAGAAAFDAYSKAIDKGETATDACAAAAEAYSRETHRTPLTYRRDIDA